MVEKAICIISETAILLSEAESKKSPHKVIPQKHDKTHNEILRRPKGIGIHADRRAVSPPN